jgi:hypothetical protein
MRKVLGVLSLTIIWIFLADLLAFSQADKSMAYSCRQTPFVGVSVSTPDHDVASPVQIKLIDPNRREQGVKTHGPAIPGSHYGVVAEIPNAPFRSLIRAVEICGADAGQYELILYEHGNSRYRVSVVAQETGTNSNSLEMHLRSKEGRVRRYRFVYKIVDQQPSVLWLDDEGHEQVFIESGEW